MLLFFFFFPRVCSLRARDGEKEGNGRLQRADDAPRECCFSGPKCARRRASSLSPSRSKKKKGFAARRPQKIRTKEVTRSPSVSPSHSFSSSQIHQAYKNDAFLYNSQGMSGNVAQQMLHQQPMRGNRAAFYPAPAGASPPPPPPPPLPPHNHHHHHASPKLWPSSQTAAVDAVAAAWAAAAARDRSSRASSGGGGEFISAQHSPPPPPHQLPQHQLLSRDSSSAFADPLVAFQQHQQLMNRPLLPRRREG